MFLYIYSLQIILEVIYIFVKNEYGFFLLVWVSINMQSRIIGYKYKINLLKYSFFTLELFISSSQNIVKQ